MNNKHLNILIPQWQGGGPDLSTYEGAQELKNHYFHDMKPLEIQISTDNISRKKNDILGYDDILTQLKAAGDVISEQKPNTIFTIGGGCDADIFSMAYLNAIHNKDITLLYLDSHGDLNTPESSESKYFYGMPLRTLLGEGDREMINLLPSTLSPDQVIMLGVRELDQAESSFISHVGLDVLSVDKIEKNIENVLIKVNEKKSQQLYIHIDLDILDPKEFPHVPVPEENGLKCNTFRALLKRLFDEFTVLGLGLLEYQASGDKNLKLIREVIEYGKNL